MYIYARIYIYVNFLPYFTSLYFFSFSNMIECVYMLYVFIIYLEFDATGTTASLSLTHKLIFIESYHKSLVKINIKIMRKTNLDFIYRKRERKRETVRQRKLIIYSQNNKREPTIVFL